MQSLDDILSAKLEKRRIENNLRSLPFYNGLIDFVSNDYLSLARSEGLRQNIIEKTDSQTRLNGSTGSRLLSGNSDYTMQVETKLAGIFSKETTIFNSGYTANLAVLSSIPQKGDTIIYDELVHASLKDGARLGHAKRFSFRHNQIEDLESKIRNAEGNVFVVVESIYSMDGDVCPIEEVIQLKKRFGFTLIVDEAHSTGIFGKGGSGMLVSKKLHDQVDIIIYTFGKAMGVHGACIAGSAQLKNYLVNFARPFIYTTALPIHGIAAIDCAFDFIDERVQQNLQDRISTFVDGFSNTTSATLSPIQTVMFPGNVHAKNVASGLQRSGFDVRPILSPTVPAGKERIRITIHLHNSNDEIMSLTKALANYRG